jgi:hypothetical protein
MGVAAGSSSPSRLLQRAGGGGDRGAAARGQQRGLTLRRLPRNAIHWRATTYARLVPQLHCSVARWGGHITRWPSTAARMLAAACGSVSCPTPGAPATQPKYQRRPQRLCSPAPLEPLQPATQRRPPVRDWFWAQMMLVSRPRRGARALGVASGSTLRQMLPALQAR